MSGYVALMNYKFLNLCVKAEPAALLPVTVEYDGTYDIEQVADVTVPEVNQMQVYPKDPALLFAIGKAIALSHPEFKQDIVTEKNDGQEPAATGDDDEDKSILLTMPEVNKDRYDVLTNGIAALYDETKAKLEFNFAGYTKRIAAKLASALPDEMDEAKKAMEEVRKQHTDLAKQYYDAKKEEIEAAYNLYLEKQTSAEKNAMEQEAATNKDAGQGFKMPEAPEMPDMPEMPTE